MYSYEDRLRAVRLYIKLGKRVGLTIRQLGNPTKNALKGWHREYEQRHDLPGGYVRQPRYSLALKESAVEHYLEHGRCIAATIKALGYPSRSLLYCCRHGSMSCIRRSARVWLVDLRNWRLQPSSRPSSPFACDRQARRRWLKSWACLEDRCTSGRMSCSATTHSHP